ncbi:nucleoside 2-deoxyribosyltransferase [Anthocerotibacter panamensis]|uniref:nucleoside 2-deoxyribosyltransferase n=1 Tax=Anthocerotibacter panamensis TaxID=2857077 RepID=UPI001C406283|nr:nucleoside 2-deoxyribosyltransferase [Anthocerotibacter panamensis]
MSTPWIYLAAPLFTQAETAFNKNLAAVLRDEEYHVFLPQEECAGLSDPRDIFATCICGLEAASLVLVILDGADADSGSCFEMGFAFARDIPILGLRTDFRGTGDDGGLNLMLSRSCTHLILASFKPQPATDHVSYFQVAEDPLTQLLPALERLEGAQQARI